MNVAASFDALGPKERLSRLLATIVLLQDADDYDAAKDRLTLTTIQAAKSLEFPVIFLVGCEKGIIPHARSFFDETAMEEERRLCYVAIIRAKNEIYFTHTKTRMHFVEFERNRPSRSLDDIPPHIVLRTDQKVFNREEDVKDLIFIDWVRYRIFPFICR